MAKRTGGLRAMEADIRRDEKVLDARRKVVAVLRTVPPKKRWRVVVAAAALLGIRV